MWRNENDQLRSMGAVKLSISEIFDKTKWVLAKIVSSMMKNTKSKMAG